MINLVPAIAGELRIQNADLLEKDIRLHRLLRVLTTESAAAKNLVFKGGTCLTKCYLGYLRFSVDLDFTWGDQSAWRGANTKKIRELTRPARRAWLESVQFAAETLGYGFDAKTDVTWGSSNRLETATLHYEALTGEPATIKLQVNFVEPLLFPVQTRTTTTLIAKDEPRSVKMLDSKDAAAYREQFQVACYAPQEIAAEKVRAILTRTAPKGRDVMDLYWLQRNLGVDATKLRKEIQAKLDFVLEWGDKYEDNLGDATARMEAMLVQDVQYLSLIPLDTEDFQAFRIGLLEFAKSFLPQEKAGR